MRTLTVTWNCKVVYELPDKDFEDSLAVYDNDTQAMKDDAIKSARQLFSEHFIDGEAVKESSLNVNVEVI
jgi:hypothetical protein